MKFSLIKAISTVVVVGLASYAYDANSVENTIGKHNLILIEDYNFTGGDVQGSAVIGGDLNANVAAEFGSRLENTDIAIDAVTVVGNVGDVNGGNVQIRVLKDNNFVYGGQIYNNTTIELNDGDDAQLIHNPAVSIADIVAELHADTAYYAGLTANGTYANGQFNYSGTEDQVVFNVEAKDIFAQNSNLSLNGTSGRTVIINVATNGLTDNEIVLGGGINLNNGFNGNAAFSSVLWNFSDATRIDFGSLNVKGSVLAPYAHTFGSANVDGAYAALSFTGAREFHNFTFNGDEPPTSTVSVPVPPMFWFILASAIALVYRRSR
ncbi:choice-of-anchor A family protein [Agaribacter marinus]|uniref:choice-of-anchor A family protein n=1 Tax=Agaribacter marinus TaxID=1431249 RepID=UPI0024E140A3|nr:choice-of-anchor A family protein [Agaribacter marinus]